MSVCVLTACPYVPGAQTWDQLDTLNPTCGSSCAYNAANRTKLWGFVSAVVWWPGWARHDRT